MLYPRFFTLYCNTVKSIQSGSPNTTQFISLPAPASAAWHALSPCQHFIIFDTILFASLSESGEKDQFAATTAVLAHKSLEVVFAPSAAGVLLHPLHRHRWAHCCVLFFLISFMHPQQQECCCTRCTGTGEHIAVFCFFLFLLCTLSGRSAAAPAAPAQVSTLLCFIFSDFFYAHLPSSACAKPDHRHL